MPSTGYWERYYALHPDPCSPSAFALAMVEHVREPGLLIELGCGNGRDTVFFGARSNLTAVAIDQCEMEIRRLNKTHSHATLKFVAADFACYEPEQPPRYVYSRWTMHAIDAEAESTTLAWVRRTLVPGGKLLIEARSLKDGLYGKGERISEHAFLTDHYRRFMDIECVTRRLESDGYLIVQAIESQGLAVHGDDDPVIVRIVAEKR